MGRLEGKVAIVVGGGQTPAESIGNGTATCLRFAQERARVVVVDRSIASAQETLDLISKEGGLARAYQLDATHEKAFLGLVEIVEEEFQKIDILHNNVGIGLNDASPQKGTEGAGIEFFLSMSNRPYSLVRR